MVDSALQIAAEGAKPAEHIFPREQNGNSDATLGGLFSVPAVDGDGIGQIPGAQRMIRGMSGGENFRDAIRIAFGFLKHRKLVGPDRLVFVDAGFHVPAREVAAKATRESAGAETADRRALPKAIVDMDGVERGLFRAGVFEWRTDGALPCGLGNVVVGLDAGDRRNEGKP